MLEREEYVEQAYFFRALSERVVQNMPTQDLLASLREEVLSTTKLPLAIDFLAGELRLQGVLGPAMARLEHYFTPFQAFVVASSEDERKRFDFRIALEILHREAAYRAVGASPRGVFLFEFEALCRNRLGYDHGLEAVARDPIFDADWREWLATVRRQIGIVDFSELLYVRSQYYWQNKVRHGLDAAEPEKPILFDEKEGKIALAHRRKDPLWLFAALQRHLGYPIVPHAKPPDEDSRLLLPTLLKRVDRLETRLKLLDEEQKGGIDLTKFYGPPPEASDTP